MSCDNWSMQANATSEKKILRNLHREKDLLFRAYTPENAAVIRMTSRPRKNVRPRSLREFSAGRRNAYDCSRRVRRAIFVWETGKVGSQLDARGPDSELFADAVRRG